jgi:VacB/RNase II family 3'-5' exoribonuclease
MRGRESRSKHAGRHDGPVNVPRDQHRSFLNGVAAEAMLEKGFEPEFPPAVQAAAEALRDEGVAPGADLRDARALPWCSIDNDDSRDLDQLTVAEPLEGGAVRILVAVADVGATVTPESQFETHAHRNTTSIYTPARVFPMLPERLSTNLTSLHPDRDRRAFVVEAEVSKDGVVGSSAVYRALVRNRAQLAYGDVGAWLDGRAELPAAAGRVPELADNLRMQDRVARAVMADRHEHGALEFRPIKVKAVLEDTSIHSLRAESRNRAQELIENFMIVANGVVARFLTDHGFPVLRRVVRSPERWGRIMSIAESLGERLPDHPDAIALRSFLSRRSTADPLRFPDLSLAIIKLLGRGEYVATFPDEKATGHFGLAITDYTHSTAPNRRYPDLVTQRLVRAVLEGRPCPLGREELRELGRHCTERENEAQKVERRLVKCAAALLLGKRRGDVFDGIVTGAGEKGVWVRIFDPPVEGRVERGATGLDVGDRTRVRLVRTDPLRGFIDFESVGHEPVRHRRSGT